METNSVQELDRRFLQLGGALKGLAIRDAGELELARPCCSTVDFANGDLLQEAGEPPTGCSSSVGGWCASTI